MLIDKHTTLEMFKELDENHHIVYITKDIALDKTWLDRIAKKFPMAEINILSGYALHDEYTSVDHLYDENETKVLAENAEYMQKQYQKTLTFDDDGFSVGEAIFASRKINSIADQINSARVDGKQLSPLEKYLYAYSIVTERLYVAENKDEGSALSRNLISVLNGDKIVCAGFANMLAAICHKIGIPCTLEVMTMPDQNGFLGNHATCCVRIEDPKYDVSGVFHADPTSDRALVLLNKYGITSFTSSLLPYSSLNDRYGENFKLDYLISNQEPTRTIKEAEEANLLGLYPKVLSYLFPEKTGGLSQHEIIKNNSAARVEDSGIKELSVALVDSLDEKNLLSVRDAFVKDNVFDFKVIARRTISYRGVVEYCEEKLKQLLLLGYTKEEAFDIIFKFVSEKTIIPEIQKLCVEKYSNDTALFRKHFDKRLQQFSSQLEEVGEDLEQYYTFLSSAENNPVEISPKKIIEESAVAIAQNAARRNLVGEISTPNISNLASLLSFGFSISDIKQHLQNSLETVDFTKIYLNTVCPSLSDLYDIDERELYSLSKKNNYGFTNAKQLIFNAPYQAAFARLASKAKPMSTETLLSALKEILLSQGVDKTKTGEIVKLWTQRTSLYESQPND